MDLSEDTGILPTHTALCEPVLERDKSQSSSDCQVESEGTIPLQMLEFKAHLLEVVEELHIRRDAVTRYEDQISKLMLKKQELEWEKESLQHQMKTAADQHTESLAAVKKQFQAKIRNIEEEKGKYQVTTELKDKEMNNLKKELKSLQLLKYNLEKTSSELEQKLALQTRTKETHLNQLGVVEKRFSSLSRQCAMIKQAHEKLEQNVDEAMKINQKLTSANQNQEATIGLLTKELDEVSKKLIKVKMTSVRHDKAHNSAGREQYVQELHQKLIMETEMSKKLREENFTERTEKRELMRSLQHTQQLLLCQTQTVGRIEMELKTQTEMYQALQQEHVVMREKSKTMEDKVVQLTATYTASKTSWDKERMVFLDCIKCEKQNLQAVKEAYEELQQRHTELSLQVKSHARHMNKMRDSSVSDQHSVMEDIRSEEIVSETTSGCELPGFRSLQHLVSSPANNPNRLEDTGSSSELDTIRASGGQHQDNHHLHILNHPDVFTCPLSHHCNSSETNSEIETKNMNNTKSEDNIVSEPIVSDEGLQTKVSLVGGDATSPSPNCGSMDESAKHNLLTEDECEEGDKGIKERKLGRETDGKQETNRKQMQITAEQQNTEECQEDVNKPGEKRTVVAQTKDRADMPEDNKGSAEGTGKTHNPETEDRADGEVTDGVKERGQTAEHVAETTEMQIPAQTTTDTREKRLTWQVNDFMDTEPPLTACETSHMSQKDADGSSLNKEDKVCSDEHQRAIQNVLSLHQDAEPLNCQSVSQGIESAKETIDDLIQLSICAPQTNDAPEGGQSHSSTDFQEQKASQAQTETCNPLDININQADETLSSCVSKECVFVKNLTGLQPMSQSQQTSANQSGELMCDGRDDADRRWACQSDGSKTHESVKTPVTTSCLEETVEAPRPEAEVQNEIHEEHRKPEQLEEAGKTNITESGADLKLSAFASPKIKILSKRDSDVLSLPCTKTYRPVFQLGTAQSKIQTKSEVSALHQFPQAHRTGPGAIRGHLLGTIPKYIKNNDNKVPLVTTMSSDLLNATGATGIAASSRRQQQGELEAKKEACRKTTEADMERRAPLSTSLSDSTSSIMESKVSWQISPACSRAPPSATGPGPESIWEPSCSQEREDQQSSLRAHISKIEQFLNTERLHLAKRRRTEP